MRQETATTTTIKRRRPYYYDHDESFFFSASSSSVYQRRRRRQQQQLKEQYQSFTSMLMVCLLIFKINIQTTLGFGGFVSTTKKTLCLSRRVKIRSPFFESTNKNQSLKHPFGTPQLFMTSTSSDSEKVTTKTTMTTQTQSTMSISEASSALSKFDQNQAKFAKTENIGMGGGVSASMYVYGLSEDELQQIRQATLTLSTEANLQRSINQTHGRIMLGICADDCQEGLTTLKSWVTTLQLPRGLLHGMDQDGIPLDPSELGSVYIKYNSGGVMTFSEMRRSGLGFDSIWKPGDALLEPYNGDFRGVYFSVELNDDEFRQYGVLPLDLFLNDE